MRIAMIGHKFYPSRMGGVEVVVHELTTRLTKTGDEITVYNRGGNSKKKHYKLDNVDVYNMWSVKKEGIDPVISSFLATMHSAFHHYDVVHYHALGPAVMLPLAKIFGKRTVATVHGLDWQRSKWGKFARMYLKIGEKCMAHFADAVITITESDHDYFLRTYHKETNLIKNAITPVEPLQANQITKAYGLSKYSYILYLGRIDVVKGINYLIEAYNRLKTDKKMVIAGALEDKKYTHYIQQLAAKNPNILLIGQAEGELLRELYSNASLYVLPSEMEGLPLSLLEAMSTGVRCLASDIPGNVSAMDEYGTTFVSKDVDSLRKTMATLLAQPDENPRGQEQIEYIKKNYSYDRVIDQTRTLYEKVAKRSNTFSGHHGQTGQSK